MIESTHPVRRPEFLHYRVRVFIDQELGLPIRFEAYDWPKHPRSEPELVEEYSYIQFKLNVGLQRHRLRRRERGHTRSAASEQSLRRSTGCSSRSSETVSVAGICGPSLSARSGEHATLQLTAIGL